MRRPLAALAALALVAPPLARAQPTSDLPVRISVTNLTPAIDPTTTTQLEVHGSAVNNGDATLRRLRISLRLGGALIGRSSIASPEPLTRGTRVGDATFAAGEMAPGDVGTIDLRVPVDRLPFGRSSQPAVYPMRIEVRTRGGRVVGAQDTFVVWWPPHSRSHTRIAWIWPLVEPSHRAVGTRFYDDELAASVKDGRLATLLRIGADSGVPLSWAVDPELLASLRTMATGFSLGTAAPHPSPEALDWLARARTALGDAAVLPLPYADPDLSAIAAGPLGPEASRAFEVGRDVLRHELGNGGSTTLAWPPSLDAPVEALLGAQGIDTVVVPDAALPLAEPLNYTPTARTPLEVPASGPTTALVADRQLAAMVAAEPGSEGARLAAQRFVADTAMITLERPGDERDVVVAPPRTWEPAGGYAKWLLYETARLPWLAPVTLDTVARDEASTAPRALAPPVGPRLSGSQVRGVADAQQRIQRLRGILTDPGRAPGELAAIDDALLRAVSARWSDAPDDGARLLASAAAAVRAQLGRLRLVTGAAITMTGRSGRIPLTFDNDLGQAVQVRIRLNSSHRLRLEGHQTYETGQPVVLAPGTSAVLVKGKAATGGVFPVTVDVLGADNRPLIPGGTVQVRSTAYGVVALAVTGVAFALLLVASATRLLRRRRAARPAVA